MFHPIRYNTYHLFKRGWRGTNIDINKTSIDLFNIARPKDKNICAAISDTSNEVDFFEDDILGPCKLTTRCIRNLKYIL